MVQTDSIPSADPLALIHPTLLRSRVGIVKNMSPKCSNLVKTAWMAGQKLLTRRFDPNRELRRHPSRDAAPGELERAEYLGPWIGPRTRLAGIARTDERSLSGECETSRAVAGFSR